MNRFKIKPGHEQDFIDVRKGRDSYLHTVPDFKEFHLLQGPSTEGYTLFSPRATRESGEAVEAWSKSEAFRKAHASAGATWIMRTMRFPSRYAIASGLLLAALALGGCCAPSECRPAKEGFVRYAPVIQALERYRQEHGAYPPALADLVPGYVPQIEQPASGELRYDRTGAGFELGFTYYGPGINNCWYESIRKSWRCSGYY